MVRAVIDWNNRNPFCSQCGQPTLLVRTGFKRACPPKDLASAEASKDATRSATVERLPCAARNTNVSFPRTDASIIVAVVSNDGKRTLLGHNNRWQPWWYNTLDEFCEPGESAEEATRCEVYEETGVRIGRVVIHSTQPWPYPSSLMIGAISQALTGADHDKELGDAKWFDLAEVEEALNLRSIPMGEPAPPHC